MYIWWISLMGTKKGMKNEKKFRQLSLFDFPSYVETLRVKKYRQTKITDFPHTLIKRIIIPPISDEFFQFQPMDSETNIPNELMNHLIFSMINLSMGKMIEEMNNKQNEINNARMEKLRNMKTRQTVLTQFLSKTETNPKIKIPNFQQEQKIISFFLIFFLCLIWNFRSGEASQNSNWWIRKMGSSELLHFSYGSVDQPSKVEEINSHLIYFQEFLPLINLS